MPLPKEGWSIEISPFDEKAHYFIFPDESTKGSTEVSICGKYGGVIRSSLRAWKEDDPIKCEDCQRILEERKKKEPTE